MKESEAITVSNPPPGGARPLIPPPPPPPPPIHTNIPISGCLPTPRENRERHGVMPFFLHLLAPRLLPFAAVLVALAALVVTSYAAPVQAQNPNNPGEPENVQLVAGDAQLTLTWSAPSSWGPNTPLRYEIDIAIGGASPPANASSDWLQLASPAASATSHTITGKFLSHYGREDTVTNGTTYHLQIRAVSENTNDASDPFVSEWVIKSGTPSVAIVQGQPGIIVSPTSLTVPVGSRACYLLRLNTEPSATLVFTATSGDTDKATVSGENMSQQHSADSGVNWKVGQAYCVKGIATGSVTISHSVTSDDTNYDGTTISDVAVTVTAADTKSTVRFLHSEMRVVEGDAGSPGEFRHPHDRPLKAVTVKLDIAPAATVWDKITWFIPHPSCPNPCVGLSLPGDSTADYAIDYVTTGLIGRQVWHPPSTNNMEFTFYIRSDDKDEDDETVRIFLLARKFTEGIGIRDNNRVCIGSCSNPTTAQQSMVIRIIDDDAGEPDCAGCGSEGELGVIRNPNAQTPEQSGHADLIADVKEWRDDPRYSSDKNHTDRWDRVLLAFGETILDASLTKMTASEAQGYADRGWSRWTAVAEALRELENE